jgi:5-methylcytosine-specific restriction endonuclease McrA
VVFVGPGSYCPPHTRARTRVRTADRPIARAVIAASPRCAHVDASGVVCGSTEDLTADHVIALAKGGSNRGRRQVLCRSHNSQKGAR